VPPMAGHRMGLKGGFSRSNAAWLAVIAGLVFVPPLPIRDAFLRARPDQGDQANWEKACLRSIERIGQKAPAPQSIRQRHGHQGMIQG